MTKDELLWAVVKALGIYFLARAVLGLGDVVTLLMQGDGSMDLGWVRAGPQIPVLLVNALLYGCVGGYMLYDGSWMMRMARRKDILADPGPGDTEVSP